MPLKWQLADPGEQAKGYAVDGAQTGIPLDDGGGDGIGGGFVGCWGQEQRCGEEFDAHREIGAGDGITDFARTDSEIIRASRRAGWNRDLRGIRARAGVVVEDELLRIASSAATVGDCAIEAIAAAGDRCAVVVECRADGQRLAKRLRCGGGRRENAQSQRRNLQAVHQEMPGAADIELPRAALR